MYLPVLLLALFVAGCVVNPSPTVVSWRSGDQVIRPPAAIPEPNAGYLVVETDVDPTHVAGNTIYYLRRAFELYSPEGRFLRRVENHGARGGEKPVRLSIPAGRYVVVSRVRASLRRVQVEVRQGVVTRVTEEDLKGAPTVPSL